jgi:formylglycine-generating enzyme required for sulfatase activity
VRRIDQRIDLVKRLLAEADAAQALVLPTNFINSLGMEMMWCPPGEFLMGSPLGEKHRWVGEGQVQVRISQGFWMASTLVTQSQWQALMGNNPNCFNDSGQLPVDTVSWNDAQDFCAKLNGIETGPHGYHYALPTEAQWEYACRAGTTGPYNGELDDVAWYYENSGNKTHEVGGKQANDWGLYDMHGNVWEWCADWYSPELEGGDDPRGPSTGLYRVFRGGGWCSDACLCRSAMRDFPDIADDAYGGFRVVLEQGRS